MEQQTFWQKAWHWLKYFGSLFIIGLLLRYLVFTPFYVDGPSMEPNFHNKEYMLISKLSYRLHEPHRGDPIVFRPPIAPRDTWIKRIIGLPGEEITIKDGKIYINGKLLKEDYLSDDIKTLFSDSTTPYQIKLKNDQYFLMGDNRESSYDSRDIGPVPKINIVGKAWIVLFPPQDIRLPGSGQSQVIAQ